MLAIFFVTLDKTSYMDILQQIRELIPELTLLERAFLINELSKGRHVAELPKPTSCPYCTSSEFIKYSFYKGNQRYSCKSCKRTFTQRTGTVLQSLKKPDDFLHYYSAMIEDGFVPMRKMTKKFGISLQTAFDWRHKALILLDVHKDAFKDITEIDDLWFRFNSKGRKDLHFSKKRGYSNKLGDNDFETKLLVAADRNNHLDMSVVRVGRIKKIDIIRKIGDRVNANTTLTSDKHSSIASFAKELNVKHVTFKAKDHVADKTHHVQYVNNIASRLKHEINHNLRGVATKYLQNYANWFKEMEVLKNEKEITASAIKDLLSQNHAWDLYLNIEKEYEVFLKKYSERTYRCPTQRFRKSQNWTGNVLNTYATY
jgi:transposase-like protein